MIDRVVAAVVCAALALAACSGDDDAAAPRSTTTINTTTTAAIPAVSTTMPTFAGDPNSPFCELVAEGDDRPVLDPFEADIDADEIELRLRNLKNRFSEFAEVAPPELVADLDALVVALDDTDEALAQYDYDITAMVDDGYTIGTLDDPVFEIVGFRLAQYRTQVCD